MPTTDSHIRRFSSEIQPGITLFKSTNLTASREHLELRGFPAGLLRVSLSTSFLILLGLLLSLGQFCLAEDATLQGALIDLRWGQACVSQRGQGHILEWSDKTLFTVDGQSTKAEDLAKRIAKGEDLSTAVRFDKSSGLMTWVDCWTGKAQPAVRLDISPFSGLAFEPNQELQLSVSKQEQKRINLEQAELLIPGVAHNLPLRDGRAVLTFGSDSEWRGIPVFLRASGKLFRGPTLSVSSAAPQVTSFGPQKASSELSKIPCWIDLDHNSDMLDFQSIRLKTPITARYSDLAVRGNRIHFLLEVDGAGHHLLEFEARDKLDRPLSQSWRIQVLP